MNSYPINTKLRMANTFVDPTSTTPPVDPISGNTLIDPTDVILFVRDPTGTETQYALSGAQVVKDSTGVYHFDLLFGISGLWFYKWQGTGTVEVTSEDMPIMIEASELIAG